MPISSTRTKDDGKDGSGVMWDCLKLEAGAAVTNGIAATITTDETAQTAYYDLRGRRITDIHRPGIFHSIENSYCRNS